MKYVNNTMIGGSVFTAAVRLKFELKARMKTGKLEPKN